MPSVVVSGTACRIVPDFLLPLVLSEAILLLPVAKSAFPGELCVDFSSLVKLISGSCCGEESKMHERSEVCSSTKCWKEECFDAARSVGIWQTGVDMVAVNSFTESDAKIAVPTASRSQ